MRYILIDTSKLGSAGLVESYFIQEKGIALDDHEALEKFRGIYEEGVRYGKWILDEFNIINDAKEFNDLDL